MRQNERSGYRRVSRTILVLLPVLLGYGLFAQAEAVRARTPQVNLDAEWTYLVERGDELPAVAVGWETRTFWDLRPFSSKDSTVVQWKVSLPKAVGLAVEAFNLGADRALCAGERARSETQAQARPLGCMLFASSDTGPLGPRWRWHDLTTLDEPLFPPWEDAEEGNVPEALEVGDRLSSERWNGYAVGEGVALLPSGPREVIVVREDERRDEQADSDEVPRRRLRFLDRRGGTVALLEGFAPGPGSAFRPDRAETLAGGAIDANDGIELPYTDFHNALTPGSTGVMQWAVRGTTPLTSLHPAWTSAGEMISIDEFDVLYQPDPGDPASEETLPEVWDWTGLLEANLTFRRMVTVRDDITGSAPACPESCAVRDQSANPADGTWQSYLKMDYYSGGALFTRDIFALNDNDTGANPTIDVSYLSQDEMNTDDWTQICFSQSAGGAMRLFRFLRFSGPDPDTATMKVGESWYSGNWTECDDSNGLNLTTASQCDPLCWPQCNDTDPRGRGLLAANAGFLVSTIEDGWVHVPAGNYIPTILIRQDTDLELGIDFLFGVCNLGDQINHSFDYYWLHEDYGLLGRVSAPAEDGHTMTPEDWSVLGNNADNAEFTWGPYPPYQTEAFACLSGTKVNWSLPADGSNLTGEPGIAQTGYVVSWGDETDPDLLGDWDTNPNRTPLPGEAGYLLSEPGSEVSSYVIDSWQGASINLTVTAGLTYTDPEYGDVLSYSSAALYKVTRNPARLDPATFRVSNNIDPFVTKQGSDLLLEWPPVDGADHYRVLVFDLTTQMEIPCPAGMDCLPIDPRTIHPGGATDGNQYGYRVVAVDPCGEESE